MDGILPPEVSVPLAALHAMAQMLLCEDTARWDSIARPGPHELAQLLLILHRELADGLADHLARAA